ncbi:MAG: hypothetical protein P8J50_08020 [Acidimicrobiales bacterium]|nr:hypothetical protein [Acidimicrobiales bacterium]
MSTTRRRLTSLLAFATVAAACTPTFWFGSTLDHAAGAGTEIRIVWPNAYDQEWPAAGHAIANYEVRVDDVLIASPSATLNACCIDGLASATTYAVDVRAVSVGGERSDDIAATGILAASVTTPPGVDPGGPLSCTGEVDTDGDRIPDWAETDTGT